MAVLIIILTAVAFIVGYSLNIHSSNLSGNVVGNDDFTNKYSWTKALCDKNKTCLDVYIECAGNRVMNVTPITGLITFDESWVDKTDKEQGLCPRS